MSAIEASQVVVLTRDEKLIQWGDGPWLDEPDRLEFRHMGLPCLMTRNPEMGNLCGYVAVPPGHPWHGKNFPPVAAHGGCNYASTCSEFICHVPEPGEPDDVWWFGFDCSHAFDLVPGYFAVLAQLASRSKDPSHAQHPLFMNERCVYRDRTYVEAGIKALAEQLYALGKVQP